MSIVPRAHQPQDIKAVEVNCYVLNNEIHEYMGSHANWQLTVCSPHPRRQIRTIHLWTTKNLNSSMHATLNVT